MKVYFHTFGCKANQYDTEMVRQAFADHGAIAVGDPASADLAVLNSCTVSWASASTRRFNSIRITGANYALRGNSLTLSNGITPPMARAPAPRSRWTSRWRRGNPLMHFQTIQWICLTMSSAQMPT